MYSNEAERANYDIYDGFKFKKPFGLHGLYKIIYQCVYVYVKYLFNTSL